MSVVVSPNDLFEIRLHGRIHGQATINTWHYRVFTDPVTSGIFASFDSIADQFIDTWLSPLQSVLSFEWAAEKLTIQKIAPARMILLDRPLAVTGAENFPAHPSSVAVVVSQFTALSGRRYQGRLFFAGIPAAAAPDSELTAPTVLAWNNALAGSTFALLDIEDDDEVTFQLQPVIFHPPPVPGQPAPKTPRPNPPWTPIIAGATRSVLRNQRRRQKGRGI